jgi:hypothetical protein
LLTRIAAKCGRSQRHGHGAGASTPNAAAAAAEPWGCSTSPGAPVPASGPRGTPSLCSFSHVSILQCHSEEEEDEMKQPSVPCYCLQEALKATRPDSEQINEARRASQKRRPSSDRMYSYGRWSPLGRESAAKLQNRSFRSASVSQRAGKRPCALTTLTDFESMCLDNSESMGIRFWLSVVALLVLN